MPAHHEDRRLKQWNHLHSIRYHQLARHPTGPNEKQQSPIIQHQHFAFVADQDNRLEQELSERVAKVIVDEQNLSWVELGLEHDIVLPWPFNDRHIGEPFYQRQSPEGATKSR